MSTGVFLSVLAGMLTTLLNLGLGVFLLLLFYFRLEKRESRRLDILFFALVVIGIGIRVASIVALEVFDKDIIWIWWLAEYLKRVGLVLFYFPFFAFSLRIKPHSIKNKWTYILSAIPFIIFILVSPLPEVGMFMYSQDTITIGGNILRGVISIYALLIFIIGICILTWKAIVAKTNKIQLRIILTGIFTYIILFLLLVTTQYDVPGEESIWSQVMTLPVLLSAVIAISRYQLFQVRKIFGQILILLGVVASMFTIRIALNLQFGTESWGLITVLLIIFVIMAAFLIREVFIRTRKEIQLSQIQQKLEDTIETKNSFMSMASLQLRTPLSVIIGYLSVLLNNPEGKYEMNDATREGLERSYKSAQNLNGIIDDMASAREVNEGEFTLDITDEVNLKDCIEEIIESKQTFFEEQDTEVHTEYMGEEFTTYVDKSKLKEALNNLVDNAVYYGDGEVQIRIEQGGKTYKISVEDNGVGLEPDEIKSLFDKFSRGKESAKINPNGSGLGLYLAKTIADKHGGRIEVESEGKGEGSTFTIVLPQRDELL